MLWNNQVSWHILSSELIYPIEALETGEVLQLERGADGGSSRAHNTWKVPEEIST